MEKEEYLLKTDVKKELVRGIELWLKSADRANEEIKQLSSGTSQLDRIFFSMAHALFLAGHGLELLTYDDYPIFKASTYTKREGK